MALHKRHEKAGSGKKKAKHQLQHHIKTPSHFSSRIQQSQESHISHHSHDVIDKGQGTTTSNKRRKIVFVYPKSQQTSSHPIQFTFNGKKESQHGNIKEMDDDKEKQEERSVQDNLTPRRKVSLDEILYPNRIKQKEPPPKLSAMTKNGNTNGKAACIANAASNDDSRIGKMSHKQSNPLDDGVHEPALCGFSVQDAVKDQAGCRPRANSTDGELNLPQRGLCDERMVLAAHKWDALWNPSKPKGLVNLGNTCFLNATIQCLVYLPTFCQSLATMKLPMNQKLSSGQKISSILQNLVRQVHGIDTSHHTDKSSAAAIAPRLMVQAVPTLGQIGSKKGYKFRPGRQEDAHEFLIHLIDAMQHGELKAAGIDQTARGWRDSLPIPRLDETTFIHRIFGGYFRSQVRCTNCSHRSNTYDPFLDLSLEVSKASCNSILSAFSEFSRNERLDEQNQWRCSGCKRHVCATKQLTVFRPPLSLCIQLKRFTYGGFGGFHKKKSFMNVSGGGGKINKPIEFPAHLALPLSDGRKCEYNLTGIIVHVGGSSSSGHYTAYVKKPQSQSNQWYHMDDSFVDTVSEKMVLQQRDAYVLFYCRKEVKLELPTPPPRSNMTAEQATAHGQARARARAESILKEPEVPPTGLSKQTLTDIVGVKALVEREWARTHTIPKCETKEPNSAERTDDSISKSDYGKSRSHAKSTVQSNPGFVLGLSAATVAAFAVAPTVVHSANTSGSLLYDHSGDSSNEEEEHAPNPREASSVLSSVDSESTNDEANLEFMKSTGVIQPSTDELSSRDDPFVNNDKHAKSVITKETHEPKIPESKRPLVGIDENYIRDGKAIHPRETGKSDLKTRVILDRGSKLGKLEVMMGPRFKTKKAWKPNAAIGGNNGEKHDLLGTMQVGKWDDDADEAPDAQVDRKKVVKALAKVESDRKRRMHLDRWDAILDQGKQKKVKAKQTESTSELSKEPKFNPFSRIQSSMQRFNRGRAKGQYRTETPGNGRPGNPGRSPKHATGRPKHSPKPMKKQYKR